MGFLDKLLGRKQCPPLPAENPVTPKIEAARQPLETLAAEVNEPLEVVPAESATYVFIGKPPKKFGLAWIEGGKLRNFKDLMDEGKLNSLTARPVIAKLRESYEQSQDVERFSTTIADREVVVTPSASLGQKVDAIIRKVA